MAARTNSQFLFASLTEFISVWGQGGEASLNLTTSAGMANVKLNCTLGHPGAQYSFPPTSFPSPPSAPPTRKPRHRGPAEKKKSQLRAAQHQATKATVPVTSDPSCSSASTASVTNSCSTPPVLSQNITAPVTLQTSATTNSFKCEKCDYTSSTEHGIKVHKGHQHKDSQKPEELRCESLENSLNVSLPSEERAENTSVTSANSFPVNEPLLDIACEKNQEFWCIKKISDFKEMVLFLTHVGKDACCCSACDPNYWRYINKKKT